MFAKNLQEDFEKKIIHNQQFISFVQSLGEKTMVNTMEQIDNFLNYEKV